MTPNMETTQMRGTQGEAPDVAAGGRTEGEGIDLDAIEVRCEAETGDGHSSTQCAAPEGHSGPHVNGALWWCDPAPDACEEYDESDVEREAELVVSAFSSPDLRDAATDALARLVGLARGFIVLRRAGAAEQRGHEDAATGRARTAERSDEREPWTLFGLPVFVRTDADIWGQPRTDKPRECSYCGGLIGDGDAADDDDEMHFQCALVLDVVAPRPGVAPKCVHCGAPPHDERVVAAPRFNGYCNGVTILCRHMRTACAECARGAGVGTASEAPRT